MLVFSPNSVKKSLIKKINTFLKVISSPMKLKITIRNQMADLPIWEQLILVPC